MSGPSCSEAVFSFSVVHSEGKPVWYYDICVLKVQNPSAIPCVSTDANIFVAFLHSEKGAPSTVKSCLSAIMYTQISLGMQDPHLSDMVQLEYVLKGLKRQAGGQSTRSHLPITPQILHQLKAAWTSQLSLFDVAILWAAATMCFFCVLRSSKVVVPLDSAFDPSMHMAYADMRADNALSPQFLEVWIKVSKTDPFRVGVAVYLGRTNCALCLVAAFLGYMVNRGGSPGYSFASRMGKR